MKKRSGHKWLAAGTTALIAEPALAMAHQGGIGVIVGLAAGAAAYALIDDIEMKTGKTFALPVPERKRDRPRAAGKPSPLYRLFVGKSVREERATLIDEETPSAVELLENNHMVVFSPEMTLAVNEVIDAGIFVSGMKGSGKSEFAARVMEEIGQYPIPQVIYDLKGDFVSLVQSDMPYVENGLILASNTIYSGETILSCGLQVVVDLRTWPDMESRAEVIARLNSELLQYAMTIPEAERFPWFVHLDEAQQYVSQQQPVGIEKHTWRWVTQSVMNLGVLGRAYGAVPCLYTQRIADIHKDVISQQELRVFMKAALHNDLQCYERYLNPEIATRETFQGFRAGDAVVVLPSGRQIVTRFDRRNSKHGSHTPHLTGVLGRRFAPLEQKSEPHMPALEPRASTGTIAQKVPPELQLALEAYKPGMSYRDLAEALKRRGHDIGKDTAGRYIQQLKAMRYISV